MCAPAECVPTPAGSPLLVTTDYKPAKETEEMADAQPYVRARRYTDQGGRRPSHPVNHCVRAIFEAEIPRSSL